jgi:hypothetical protein
VLPAAINVGIRIEAAPAERIRLTSQELDGVALCAPDGRALGEEPQGWSRYVADVAAELALLGRPPVGLEGEITSTLPIGTGLSSSAALEVAVAIALCAVADFRLEPLELALAARRAEHRAVGVPSGIMDQAASLLGRAGHALLLDTDSLEYEHVPLPPELTLVVVYSGVSRQLEHSGYGQRRQELEALGFRAQGATRRGGRMWTLPFNRFLTFMLHDYDDDLVLTWTFELGEYLLERGWQTSTTDTSATELYPARDVRLPLDIDAVQGEITRVLTTLRLDLGDPHL